MPNHPHEPTPETRSEVQALASFGVNREDIAAYIGIAKKTLLKHYQEELQTSAVKAHATVGKFLYKMASGQALKDGASHAECSRAAMFWAKTQMGWRETNHYDHTSSDGSMTPERTIDPTKLSDSALEELNGAFSDDGQEKQ